MEIQRDNCKFMFQKQQNEFHFFFKFVLVVMHLLDKKMHIAFILETFDTFFLSLFHLFNGKRNYHFYIY